MTNRAKPDGERVGENYRGQRGTSGETDDRLFDSCGDLKMTGAPGATVATPTVAKRGGKWGVESVASGDGPVVSGIVEGNRDTIGISGEIVRRQINGDASVTIGE